MLTIHACRSPGIEDAFIEALKAAQTDPEQTHYIIVPSVLTLQTERLLMRRLNITGSFTLQVTTPQRFCLRIFENTGAPELGRVNQIGRIMLARAAVESVKDELTHFNKAVRQRGFAVKCSEQLARLRQASLTPETLEACASADSGILSEKLHDLALIQRAYEQRLEGHYQDSESEFMMAIARVSQADFLRGAKVWFYGFDVMPADLARLTAAVAAVCPDTYAFIPADMSAVVPDGDCFRPLVSGIERMEADCRLFGAEVRRVIHLPGAKPKTDTLSRLAAGLYCIPSVKPSDGDPETIKLMRFRNVSEECAYAAATCRHLARTKGLRWRDMHILCGDIAGYREPLRTAFRAYGIPLFASESRPAANYPLCECLLSALKIAEGSGDITDVLSMMRTGYMPVLKRDVNRLADYAERYGLRGSAFLKPFTRGKEGDIVRLENARQDLMAPVLLLRDTLREAKNVREQMTAAFQFLQNIGASRRLYGHVKRLTENGLREAACEESQIWKALITASDQLVALLGDEKLSLRDLCFTLAESLSAVVLKPLPQSDDAVCAQGMNSMLTQDTRVLILMGETDSAAEKPDGLLDTAQKHRLSRETEAYLGPDERELTHMRRFRTKHALAQTTGMLLVSMSQTGATGDDQLPSPLFNDITTLFPNIEASPVLHRDELSERVLRSSPAAALSLAARGLSEAGGSVRLSPNDAAVLSVLAGQRQWRESLERVRLALHRSGSLERLLPDTARALYGEFRQQSVSSLESFTGCPFRYFVRYGIRVRKIQPVPLDVSDEGSFLHACVETFLHMFGSDLSAISKEQAHEQMNLICDIKLNEYREKSILNNTPLDRSHEFHLRMNALNAADLILTHMRGSGFRVDSLEKSFGGESDPHPLTIEDIRLYGRIDRADICADQNAIRIIDYKRAQKELDLADVYNGLSLQLPVYAAYATREMGAQNAGMYYLRLGKAIISNDSRDPAVIEAERLKELRMNGLAPDDEALRKAISPDFDKSVKAMTAEHKKLYASQEDYRVICETALRRVAESIRGIQEGEAAIAPVVGGNASPCDYCDYRALCMFDPALDAQSARRPRAFAGNRAALKAMYEEEGERND